MIDSPSGGAPEKTPRWDLLGIEGCCRRSGNGEPPTCLPAACGVAQKGAQHGPSSPTQTQDPREGPSLAGRTTRSFLRHDLVRMAHEEVERPGGVPHEVPVTQAMTTEGARRVPAHAVSSFPLWCKGGKRSRGVPRHQAKVAIPVQRDQDQEDYKTEVIVEPKTASSPELCAGEDYFCPDS